MNPPRPRPVVDCPLIADGGTIAFLGQLYQYMDTIQVPTMRRGLLRRLKLEVDKLRWGAFLHVALPWDPTHLSFKAYLIIVKMFLHYAELHNVHVTIIWPTLERVHSRAEIRYLTQKAIGFKHWMWAKRLIADVCVPANPLPAVNVKHFRGSVAELYGIDFCLKLNRNVPHRKDQTLEVSNEVYPIPTVPEEQDLATFISMRPA